MVNDLGIILNKGNDYYSDDSLFNTSSWVADVTYEELVSMCENHEFMKRDVKHYYAWDLLQASRFIESILLGVPIPSIVVAVSGNDKIIIDGFQRIISVYDYMHGVFSKDDQVFKLNEQVNKRWRNKGFKDLTYIEQTEIKKSTIHVIVIKYRDQQDNTGLYQLFERMHDNYASQEIRDCVYQGTFNDLLIDLNNDSTWRTLCGSVNLDPQKGDVECILRFLMMISDQINIGQISLKKQLNLFMQSEKNATKDVLEQYKDHFISTINYVYKEIGNQAFYTNGKFSSILSDAIMSACYQYHISHKEIVHIPLEKQEKLLQNIKDKVTVSSKISYVENVRSLINFTEYYLYGACGDHEG